MCETVQRETVGRGLPFVEKYRSPERIVESIHPGATGEYYLETVGLSRVLSGDYDGGLRTLENLRLTVGASDRANSRVVDRLDGVLEMLEKGETEATIAMLGGWAEETTKALGLVECRGCYDGRRHNACSRAQEDVRG